MCPKLSLLIYFCRRRHQENARKNEMRSCAILRRDGFGVVAMVEEKGTSVFAKSDDSATRRDRQRGLSSALIHDLGRDEIQTFDVLP